MKGEFRGVTWRYITLLTRTWYDNKAPMGQITMTERAKATALVIPIGDTSVCLNECFSCLV
jgi:hypothetical protein